MKQLLAALFYALLCPLLVAQTQVTVVSPATSNAAAVPLGVNNDGLVNVETTAHQVFQDTFSFGLDLTNKWAATTGGNGVAATNSVGATVLSSGTTLNSFSKLTTSSNGVLITFAPTDPGYIKVRNSINIETPVLTTGHRFWGLGTSGATPTMASPLIDAIGIEIRTDGHFDCVTYASGGRTLIRDLTVAGLAPVNYTLPFGGPFSSHAWLTKSRGDTATYYVDQLNPVTGIVNLVPACQWSAGPGGPDVNDLPVLLQAISNGGTAVTIQDNGTIVSDTGGNPFYIVDGVYPWRRQVICDKTGVVSAVGAATVQLVGTPPQGVNPNSTIKVCGITFANTNATPTNVKLVEGTGALCATAQTAVTGNFGLAATPSNFSPPAPTTGPIRTNVAGDALCVTGSAAGAVDVTFQFYQGP